MAQTTAERQQAWRSRRAAELGELRDRVTELETRLAAALTDVERLSAKPPCPHPAEAIQEGVCRLCNADVW